MVVANHNTNDFKGETTMDILNPMGLEVRCKKINGRTTSACEISLRYVYVKGNRLNIWAETSAVMRVTSE